MLAATPRSTSVTSGRCTKRPCKRHRSGWRWTRAWRSERRGRSRPEHGSLQGPRGPRRPHPAPRWTLATAATPTRRSSEPASQSPSSEQRCSQALGSLLCRRSLLGPGWDSRRVAFAQLAMWVDPRGFATQTSPPLVSQSGSWLGTALGPRRRAEGRVPTARGQPRSCVGTPTSAGSRRL